MRVKNMVALVWSFLILSSAGAAVAADFVNSLGMEFVKIEAGIFMMGNPDRYAHLSEDDDEVPLHEVVLTEDFLIGAHEVTLGQWKEIMGFDPGAYEDERLPNRDRIPVTGVTYDQVEEFLQKLNQREGTFNYRLPTEAEWEYAVRAGTDTPWHFGDDFYQSVHDYEWVGDTADTIMPVGRLKPNPWGLYDVHGNVKELVSDFFKEEYYSESPREDPKGPGVATSDKAPRSVRGGAWYNSKNRSRSSYRFFLYKNETNEDVGFRVAMSGAPPASPKRDRPAGGVRNASPGLRREKRAE